jgi:hypothetical protein
MIFSLSVLGAEIRNGITSEWKGYPNGVCIFSKCILCFLIYLIALHPLLEIETHCFNFPTLFKAYISIPLILFKVYHAEKCMKPSKS